MAESPQPVVPEAVAQERTGWSVVWLIPLVAVVAGGWLAYRALMEKGPEIQILFNAATGLEAGKTKIKYRNVQVGKVTAVTFDKDLSRVVVTAELHPTMRDYLHDKTRFWIVTARLAAGEVSGLETLLSGAYIAMDPTREGKPARIFRGLDKAPVITGNVPGTRFELEAESLGSIEVGSPVYYRKIRVGRVEEYHLKEDGSGILFKIFVETPYDELVRRNTRFWNASGVEVNMDATGFRFRTESLVSVLIGGIAFDTPRDLEPSDRAGPGTRFRLYRSREETLQTVYLHKERYLVYFDRSVRGLKVGAPVLIRGIEVGKVVDVRFEFDVDTLEFRIPVLIEIEPERVRLTGKEIGDPQRSFYEELVAAGLRAQLQTGNLLTGQLLVELDMHPESPPAPTRVVDGYRVIPSVPGDIDQLKQGLMGVLRKIEALPLEEIGRNLNETLAGTRRIAQSEALTGAIEHLNATLAETRQITGEIHRDLLPELGATVEQARRAAENLNGLLRPGSPLYEELRVMVRELSASARSIRMMADYLEQHPDALLKGKRP